MPIHNFDRNFLNILRGASILRVMLAHLGLSWFYPPYSNYITLFLPVLFFVSGAVSFNSFGRVTSIGNYAFKRLVGILMPYLVLFACITFVALFKPSWDIGSPLNWLLMSPDTEQLPFGLEQSWFLQSLFIVLLISIAVFKWSFYYKSAVTLVCGILLMLIVGNSFIDIHQLLKFGRMDIYLALSNGFYFFMGALFVEQNHKFTNRVLTRISLLCLFCFVVSILLIDGFIIGDHISSPSVIYVFGALPVLLLLIRAKYTIAAVMNKIMPLQTLMLFCNKHSYALFLLHSVIIAFYEIYVFSQPLTGNYPMALIKMFLVIFTTMLIAPIFTYISKYLSIHLLNVFEGNRVRINE